MFSPPAMDDGDPPPCFGGGREGVKEGGGTVACEVGCFDRHQIRHSASTSLHSFRPPTHSFARCNTQKYRWLHCRLTLGNQPFPRLPPRGTKCFTATEGVFPYSLYPHLQSDRGHDREHDHCPSAISRPPVAPLPAKPLIITTTNLQPGGAARPLQARGLALVESLPRTVQEVGGLCPQAEPPFPASGNKQLHVHVPQNPTL